MRKLFWGYFNVVGMGNFVFMAEEGRWQVWGMAIFRVFKGIISVKIRLNNVQNYRILKRCFFLRICFVRHKFRTCSNKLKLSRKFWYRRKLLKQLCNNLNNNILIWKRANKNKLSSVNTKTTIILKKDRM